MVQFNVLADGLSGRDTKLGGFDSAPKDSLKWEARRERLVEELFRHPGREPDVICLEGSIIIMTGSCRSYQRGATAGSS